MTAHSETPGRNGPSIVLVVIVTLVSVSTLVLGSFGIYNYEHEKEYRWNSLRTDLRVTADQMTAGLALPVWNIDREQIDKVIESSMNDRNIMGIVVFAAGRNHIRTRNSSWDVVSVATPFPTDGLEEDSREIRFAGETVGQLHLYITPRFIEREVQVTLISSFIAIVVFDLLLTVGLYLLLWRSVLRPLRQVEIFAGEVSSGLSTKIPGGTIRFGGELASLKSSIEKMVLLLDARYRDLQEIAAAHRAAEEEIRVSHDRLRSLTERITAVREEEKTRLAHEIHDEFGQVLSAMKMDLAYMARKLQTADPAVLSPQTAQLLSRVDAMSSTIDSTIVKIRQIAIDLRPDLLDNLGLAEAINWYAEEFQNRSGITCHTMVPNTPFTVPPEAATALFRITQEALTNVARHSGATDVTISLANESGDAFLRIHDNGRGIHPEEMVKTTSMGLLGMRERVHRFNGNCTISGSSGKGTTVTISIPQIITSEDSTV